MTTKPERDETESERPWDEPGAVRRDCDPHRGDLLRLLGFVSVFAGAMGFFWGLGSPFGLLIGGVTGILAGRDLARMRAGSMDPTGEEMTRRARQRAWLGIGLGIGFLILWLVMLMLLMYWRDHL